MKTSLILMASLAMGMLSSQAGAAGSSPTSLEASGAPYQVALVWRCGRYNPAMWGTFGNGCLKQKRAYKKNGGNSSSAGHKPGLAVKQPVPPPPPPPSKLKLKN